MNTVQNQFSVNRATSNKQIPAISLTLLVLLGFLPVSGTTKEKTAAPALEQEPKKVTALLASADAWLLPQPKQAGLTGGGFDVKRAGKIRLVGSESEAARKVLQELPGLLKERSGMELKNSAGLPILLGVFPDGKLSAKLRGIGEAELKDLGPEGYVLHIDSKGISAAAASPTGLRYATRTLAQLAADRVTLPGLHIRDWPAMKYRGAQQDVCRGQVPTVETIKRLTRVLAEAKMNILQFYIEHTYKFKAHPDSSPPEGYSPEDAREMFKYAANLDVELQPMFQVLGHAGTILSKPQFVKYAVRPRDQIWTMTYDIRKPETVNFVLEMVKELQDTMPSKLFTVDVTEIDAEGFNETGTKTEDIGRMILDYVIKLQEVLSKKGARLVIVQGALQDEGAMGGLGGYLTKLPKESMVASYYTTTFFNKCWEKDFSRLKELKIDFLANAWIYGHVRLMPWAGGAADFSDAEVGKSLLYGSSGSITCDWGDEGHFHFVGQEWYPFLYHGASAWTGANVDRDYFNQAFTRLFYGIKNDSVARAILLATSIYGRNVPVRDDQGKVSDADPMNVYLWGFLDDPWTEKNIASLADRVATGQQVIATENQAAELMKGAMGQAKRNQDNLEQLMFGILNYQAMGKKFIASGHYLDAKVPRAQVIQELEEVVRMYETSKADYRRMWLAEDRENTTYHNFLAWYDRTIVPCKQKVEELKKQPTEPSKPTSTTGAPAN